jgi:hypothetical protein
MFLAIVYRGWYDIERRVRTKTLVRSDDIMMMPNNNSDQSDDKNDHEPIL